MGCGCEKEKMTTNNNTMRSSADNGTVPFHYGKPDHPSGYAVVLDMDGTLFAGNSLKWALELGLKRLLRRGHIVSMLTVLSLGGLKALHLISHETMKYGALRIFGDDAALTAQLQQRASALARPEVARIINEAQQHGDRILLATAASDSYVPQLWEGEYIASPFGGPDLRGERKAAAISRWLEENSLKLRTFITDHRADLPSAKLARELGAEVLLTAPTSKSLTAFSLADIPYRIITA